MAPRGWCTLAASSTLDSCGKAAGIRFVAPHLDVGSGEQWPLALGHPPLHVSVRSLKRGLEGRSLLQAAIEAEGPV